MNFCEWYVNGLDIAINVFGWYCITHCLLKIGFGIKACIYNIVDEIMNKGEEEENVEMG